METWAWIVVAVLVAALAVLAVAFARIRRRRSHLKKQFGVEYERAVASSGVAGAEKDLADTERQHEELRIRPLPQAARDRYLEEWRQAETRFVTDPRDAVRAADRIVQRALEDSGYPAEGDTDQRARLVAADHPDAAERYRHGQWMLEKDAESTENLRKAMIDFRSVLDELLERTPTAA